MRRWLGVGVALGLGLLASPSALAGVTGTKHDLSISGGGMWGSTDETQVCIFCHTPHNANPGVPLWNHEVNTDTFDLFASSTLNATVGQPTYDTLLCMSCHDGTIALNSILHGGTPTMDPAGDQLGDIYYPGSPFGQGPNIGGSYPANPNVDDLADDHPVSFVFNAGLIALDNKLQLPPGGSPVKLRGPSSNRVECTSCHNVHDDTNAPFLVMSNANSQLCVVCHVK